MVVGLRSREAQKEVNRYEVARRTTYVVARCDEEVSVSCRKKSKEKVWAPSGAEGGGARAEARGRRCERVERPLWTRQTR